jgi:hypothetical protein
MADPSIGTARLTKCLTRILHETSVFLVLAATQVNAITTIRGTVWMGIINQLTRPRRSVLWRISKMNARRATCSAACPEVVLFVALHTWVVAAT